MAKIVVDSEFRDNITSGVDKALSNARGSVSRFSNILDIAGGNIFANIAAKIAGSIIDIGASIFNSTAEFEKFNAVLTNTFQNSYEASNSMNMLAKIAKQTPFQLDEITNSYVKLVNRGFKPTEEEIIKLGDLASTSGKGFDQLAEALLDAETGQMERLLEFGIKATKSGDKVRFMFKGVSTEVRYSQKGIRDYILSLGELNGVQGTMKSQTNTLGGAWNNLKDNLSQLGTKVGSIFSGTVVKVMNYISTLIESINKEGTFLNKVFTTTGEIFSSLFKILGDVSKGFDTASKSGKGFVENIKNTETIGQKFGVTMAAITQGITGVAMALNDTLGPLFSDIFNELGNIFDYTINKAGRIFEKFKIVMAAMNDPNFFQNMNQWEKIMNSSFTKDAMDDMIANKNKNINKLEKSIVNLREKLKFLMNPFESKVSDSLLGGDKKGNKGKSKEELTNVTNLSTERNVRSLTVNVDKMIGVETLQSTTLSNSEAEIQRLVIGMLKKLVMDKSLA